MSPPQRSALRHYAVAVFAALGAVLVRNALDPALGTAVPFILAFPAVMVAGYYGGFGPGLLAAAVSIAATSLVLHEARQPIWSTPAAWRILLFGFSGVLISLLCELLHRERRRGEASGREQVRAEAKLRETISALADRDDRLRVIMNAVPALISYIGTDARYVLANLTYQRWFGFPPAAIHGKHMRELLGEEAWQKVKPWVERAIAGEDVTYEEELPYRGVGPRWVQVSYVADRAPDGTVRGIVALVNDVSERKHADEERARLLVSEQQARARAEASDKAKDQFLAVLSHELRTPLTPVLAAAQMLETNGTWKNPERVRALAALVRRNAELEARLIDDLLDLTRVSRGKLSLHFEAVDAHAKVREVLSACARELEAKQLRVELALDAVEHHVRADQARFQQVIWNLVKNAVKFSHECGQVVIRTYTGSAGELVVEVSDQGVGIDRELLPRLFNAFEQGSREVTRHFGGLGLGLAVSKALVEAQGGTIAATSDGKERGATFTVTMPVARASTTITQRSRGEEMPSMSHAHRILLVEDHEDTSEVMAEFLQSSGYEVTTADTVASALEIAGTENFDLVLSDLGLPDGTGYELMRALRQRHQLRGVALSGYGRDKDVEEARAAGFVEHVTKPPNPQQLLKVLSRVLEGPATTTR